MAAGVCLGRGKEAASARPAVVVPGFQRVLTSVLLTSCQMLCKNVRDLEVIDVSNCAALTQRAVRAISFYCRGLNTLRMSGCPEVPDQRLHTSAFLKRLLSHIRAFQDDRSGNTFSDERLSVPARTRHERLRSAHRLHRGILAQELPPAFLSQDGLLQRHLQVKHVYTHTHSG